MKIVMSEEEFEKLILKVLHDFKDCNLRSNIVRQRIAREIKIDTKHDIVNNK